MKIRKICIFTQDNLHTHPAQLTDWVTDWRAACACDAVAEFWGGSVWGLCGWVEVILQIVCKPNCCDCSLMNSIQTKRYKSPTSWEVWGRACGLWKTGEARENMGGKWGQRAACNGWQGQVKCRDGVEFVRPELGIYSCIWILVSCEYIATTYGSNSILLAEWWWDGLSDRLVDMYYYHRPPQRIEIHRMTTFRAH